MSNIIHHFSPEPLSSGVRVSLGLGSHHVSAIQGFMAQHPVLAYCHFTSLYERAGKTYELSGLEHHIQSLDIQEDLFVNQPFFQDQKEFRIIRAQTDLSWEDFNALYRVRRRK